MGVKECLMKCCIPQRIVFSTMGFLAMVNAYTMRVCLSVAVTEMVAESNITFSDECPATGEEPLEHGGQYDWSPTVKGQVIGGFYYGYLVSHIPGGYLVERYGGKQVLVIGLFLTAIMTLLFPISADLGVGWAIVTRVIAGLGEGTTFPALNGLVAQWIPPGERGLLGAYVMAGSLIGTVVGQSISGWIIFVTEGRWPIVFYLFGIACIIWCIFFELLCTNTPAGHPLISDKEKEYILSNLQGVSGLTRHKVPFKLMFKCVPLWALIFAQIGHDWGFYNMVSELPQYLKYVLRMNVQNNGMVSSIPYFVMWISSLVMGWVADVIIVKGWLSTTNTRKLFTTIASVGPAVFLVAASYSGCHQIITVIHFTISMGLMAGFYPGMKVNAIDLSPNYAGFLMGIVNGLGAITGFAAPATTEIMTPNNTMKQWQAVFWVSFAVFIFTNIIFVIFGSGEIQSFNDYEDE